MRRAIEVREAANWTEAETVSQVTLAFDDRHRRRIKLSDDTGEEFLLDLDEAVRLSEGDGLVLDTGGIIAVRAANEDVLDISCETAADAARIAWHIGNRHTPMQVLATGILRITYDHVLKAMIEGLGAECRRRSSPFTPEPGAYTELSGHGHAH
ncbi:MAG: urease accessory protein UreE [Rhodospirillales bacterium]|nr:urease accessory protein UreE [Rhodospirillales bacterium]